MEERAVWRCVHCAMGPCVVVTNPTFEMHYMCLKDGGNRAYWQMAVNVDAKLDFSMR